MTHCYSITYRNCTKFSWCSTTIYHTILCILSQFWEMYVTWGGFISCMTDTNKWLCKIIIR